ncbi:MAG: hypothetical protein KatS3mg111_3436 [Pirellulaceae bacterium]|nr:MAG: hypothetical protein KatS3mg111_3436 [Pirellulaceae bacterium]
MNAVEIERRILIIDDNVAIHRDFEKILSRQSDSELDDLGADLFGNATADTSRVFNLSYASQGEEGVAMAKEAVEQQRPFALAFVDMRMPPGWDGVETIRQLWKIQPNLQVVICTAYSDYTWSKLVAELGESDHLLILRKPFDSAEVCQLAAALTKKFAMEIENAQYRDQLERQLREKSQSLDLATSELEASHALFQATLDALTAELAVLDEQGVILTRQPRVGRR